MKIKLDENLPARIAALLETLGHDVETVSDEGLLGRPDSEIWEAAQREQRLLITQDLDFSDSRKFAPGSHHGLLLIRLHSPNRRNLIDRIAELFRDEKENAATWTASFVIATERKIRILRPESSGNP